MYVCMCLSTLTDQLNQSGDLRGIEVRTLQNTSYIFAVHNVYVYYVCKCKYQILCSLTNIFYQIIRRAKTNHSKFGYLFNT